MAKRKRRYVGNPYVELRMYGRKIILSEKYRRLLAFKQHHNSNTFLHSVFVALRALTYAKDHLIKIDVESMVKMALLHDYFLYDWHVKPHPKKHATQHPLRAAENAAKDFGLDEFELSGIRSHMWPIAPFRIPRSREAWILAHVDKCVTLNEVAGRKQKFQRDRLKEVKAYFRSKEIAKRLKEAQRATKKASENN